MFSAEIAHYKESSISDFEEVFNSTDKIFKSAEDQALGNNSMEFIEMEMLPNFLKFQILGRLANSKATRHIRVYW